MCRKLVYSFVAAFHFLFGANSSVLAQYNTVENRVLDNSKVQFDSLKFVVDKSASTVGGSSLRSHNLEGGGLTPHVDLYFQNAGQTVVFDWRFTKQDSSDQMRVTVYNLLAGNASVARNLPQSSSWCREYLYVPHGDVQVQWHVEGNGERPTAGYLDNVKLLPGNQVRSRRCGISPESSNTHGKNVNISPLIALLLDDASSATPYVFEGNVKLPEGVVAGSGGATVKVNTFPLDFVDVDLGNGIIIPVPVQDTVVIAEGESSAPYKLQFPEDGAAEKSLEFECLSGCVELDTTNIGAWSESDGVVGSPFSSTRYASIDGAVVDIVLEAADYFRGTVRMPAGSSVGTEFIPVRINDATSLSFDSYTTYISPQVGEDSWEFIIGTPTDLGSDGWEIEVDCVTNCFSGIEQANHYPTTVTGDPTTLDSNSQFLFNGGSDYSNIIMTLKQTAP